MLVNNVEDDWLEKSLCSPNVAACSERLRKLCALYRCCADASESWQGKSRVCQHKDYHIERKLIELPTMARKNNETKPHLWSSPAVDTMFGSVDKETLQTIGLCLKSVMAPSPRPTESSAMLNRHTASVNPAKSLVSLPYSISTFPDP